MEKKQVCVWTVLVIGYPSLQNTAVASNKSNFLCCLFFASSCIATIPRILLPSLIPHFFVVLESQDPGISSGYAHDC